MSDEGNGGKAPPPADDKRIHIPCPRCHMPVTLHSPGLRVAASKYVSTAVLFPMWSPDERYCSFCHAELHPIIESVSIVWHVWQDPKKPHLATPYDAGPRLPGGG